MKLFYLASTLLLGTAMANQTQASECETSTPLTSGILLENVVQTGSIAGETWSGTSQCSGPGERADVWFSFEAVATTSFLRVRGNGDFDAAFEVFDACGGTVLGCRNATGPGGIETLKLSNLTVGETYYFAVWHAGDPDPDNETFTAVVGHIPFVELRSQDCDQLEFTTNSIIRSLAPQPNSYTVIGYEWRFEELEAPFEVYERISPNGTNPNYGLKWFDAIEYGRSYDVSVRVLISEGNVTAGDYGNVCTIGLQDDVLSTQLQAQFANQFFNFCDVVAADPVGAATQYRWEFNDLSTTVEAFGDGNNRLFRLRSVPGLQLAQTYIVTAFATVAGVESPQGTARFITMNNFVPNTGLRQDLYPCGGTYPINSFVQATEICVAQSYTWRFNNTSQSQPTIFYTRSDGSRFIRLDWITDLIPGDNYDVDVRASQGGLMGDYSVVCNITVGAASGIAPATGLDDDAVLNPLGISELSPNEDSFAFDAVLSGNEGSADGLQVHITNERGGLVRIELFDLSGKMVDSRQETVEGYTDVRWNTSSLSRGMYLMRLSNGTDVVTKKLIR